MATSGWRRGFWGLTVQQVSEWGDEKVLEMHSGDGCIRMCECLVHHILDATELQAYKKW